MFLWPMHIISYVVFASVLQYNWGISWRTWQDLRDFPFASCTDVFCGGPIPGESPSWTVFENWCEYTYSLYSVRIRSWPNEDPTDSTCSQPFSDKVFSNWNLAFSSFSFLVLTNQHWVSGISRQKKWSHVSAFQTFEHCGCFQHCCPNEQPVFVIWAILGWHWWPLSYLQHLLRCYFQELRCCGESKSIFFFLWKKMFLFLFYNRQISLKSVTFEEKGTDYDLWDCSECGGVTGWWVQSSVALMTSTVERQVQFYRY